MIDAATLIGPDPATLDASLVYGITEPRLWTKPLRPLTPETSAGFDVIEFGEDVCDIFLFPWQKWLLIHALELNEDGTYRFRKIHILVGRQNGKTTLMKLLILYWLFIESTAAEHKIDPPKFKIVATAQDLGKAEETWEEVLDYCDPAPPKDKDPDTMPLVPALQQLSRKPSRKTNNFKIRTRAGSSYSVASIAGTGGGRGGSYARVFLDELREHRNWSSWSAVKNTKNSLWNSQVWTASNAGDRRAVVLKSLRKQMLKSITDWDRYVEQGTWDIEQWANEHDSMSALFEWSAEPGKPVTDVMGIRQANPSLGYGQGRLEVLLADAKSDPEGEYRTEVLCQWVEALVTPHVSPVWWKQCADKKSVPVGRIVASMDVSFDRKRAYIGIAGMREDGVPHVELIARRAGSTWTVKYMKRLRKKWGVNEIAIQARGCGASEYIELLREADFVVHEIGGFMLGASAGKLKDRVESGGIKHRNQRALNLSVEGAEARRMQDQMAWDRAGSIVDASPAVCVSQALYVLETVAEPEPEEAAYEERGIRVLG